MQRLELPGDLIDEHDLVAAFPFTAENLVLELPRCERLSYRACISLRLMGRHARQAGSDWVLVFHTEAAWRQALRMRLDRSCSVVADLPAPVALTQAIAPVLLEAA